ncbi:Transposase, partial [Phytophthora megakarya]
AIVRTPFAQGESISILAGCDINGFVAWRTTRGTFDRVEFHRVFVDGIVPYVSSIISHSS